MHGLLCVCLDMVDINVIREECFLDEILVELPNRVAKPTPGVKGKNLKKFFNQFSDSLKDIQLQYTCIDVSSVAFALGTNVGNAYVYQRTQKKILKISSEVEYVQINYYMIILLQWPTLVIYMRLSSQQLRRGSIQLQECFQFDSTKQS